MQYTALILQSHRVVHSALGTRSLNRRLLEVGADNHYCKFPSQSFLVPHGHAIHKPQPQLEHRSSQEPQSLHPAFYERPLSSPRSLSLLVALHFGPAYPSAHCHWNYRSPTSAQSVGKQIGRKTCCCESAPSSTSPLPRTCSSTGALPCSWTFFTAACSFGTSPNPRMCKEPSKPSPSPSAAKNPKPSEHSLKPSTFSHSPRVQTRQLSPKEAAR